MAAPKFWQILQRVQSDLDGMTVAGGYNFDPDAVYIGDSWSPQEDKRFFNPGLTTIYGVRPGNGVDDEDSTGDSTTGGYSQAVRDLHILVSRRFNTSSPAETPGIVEVREQMIQDVKRVLLFTDPQLGGLALNVGWPPNGISTDVEFYVPGWVAAEITCRVAYEYPAVSP